MSEHRLNSQSGSVTTEFVMVVPLLAMAMLFLLGLGYTLMTKQNAVVGARSAVFYRVTLEQEPSAQELSGLVRDSASPGREDWRVDDATSPQVDPDLGGVGRSEPDLRVGDIIRGTVEAIYQEFNQDVGYRVSTAPTLGFLPGVLGVNKSKPLRAQAEYHLPHGTWTCKQTGGGTYLSIAFSQIGVPSWLSDKLHPNCCKTY